MSTTNSQVPETPLKNPGASHLSADCKNASGTGTVDSIISCNKSVVPFESIYGLDNCPLFTPFLSNHLHDFERFETLSNLQH